MFTTTGVSGVALAIGSFSPNRPQYIAIGSGSGTVAVSNVSLASETSRRTPTTIDTSTVNEILYTGDWNSADISGTTLTEFGLFTYATGGSIWTRENFTGVEFNGSNELQIQLTLESY